MTNAYTHEDGRTFALGRQPYKHDDRTLKLADFLAADLIYPTVYDGRIHVSGMGNPFPIDGNDAYGCCVTACYAHLATLLSAIAGHPVVPTQQQAEQLYFDLCNGGQPFAPGAPQDRGLVELDTLKYLRNHPEFSDAFEVVAFALVDATNHAHMKIAMSLFGGVMSGIGLPITAQQQVGKVWKLAGTTGNGAPYTWGGHCTLDIAYNRTSKLTETWGMEQLETWGWNDEYQGPANQGEAWAIITSETLKTPGLDAQKLMAALAAIGQVE